MAQIVPGLPGLGYYVGSGISTGLQELAAQRVQNLQRQQKANSLISAGFTPEEAGFIVDNPELAAPFLSSLSVSGNVSQQQAQQPMAQDLAQMLSPTQQQSQQPLQQLQQATPQQKVVEEFKATNLPEQKPEVPQVAPKQTIKEQLAKGISSKEDARLKQQEAKDRKAEEARIAKETLPYYTDLLKEEKASKNNLKRIDRMEHLVKQGGLPIAAFYKLFDDLSEISPIHAVAAGTAIGTLAGGGLGSLLGPAGAAAGSAAGRAAGPVIGGVIGSLVQPVASLLKSAQRFTSPNTEEYEKLTADFIKDAKQFFGARVTNDELKAFLKTVPSLAVSDAGKLQIINNMRNFYQVVELKAEAMKDIIKENGGKRPANLELLVEERIADDVDTLADNFINGVKKGETIADKNAKKLAKK